MIAINYLFCGKQPQTGCRHLCLAGEDQYPATTISTSILSGDQSDVDIPARAAR